MPNDECWMIRSCDSDLRLLEFAPLAHAQISMSCSARPEGPATPSFPPVVVNRLITLEARLGRVCSDTL